MRFHQSLAEAHEELHCALDEVRESVEGIPVSIVPGTRVLEALPQPPALPERPLAVVPVRPVLSAPWSAACR